MKKSVQFLCYLSILVVFLSLGILASAQNSQQSAAPDAQSQPSNAQHPDAQPPSSKPAQPPDQAVPPADDSGSQAGTAQTFMGTILKSGDKYVFQEDTSGKTYDIDHQSEVQKFEGKKVKVQGTLDASGKMIHVQP
jgi:hypothetical protein